MKSSDLVAGKHLSKLAVLSVAMLKVNWDQEGRDYISYLMPFVANVLRLQPGSEVTSTTTRELIVSEYGLEIPSATVELCLRRLVPTCLRRERGRYWLHGQPPAADFEAQRAFAKRHTDLVVSALLEFVKSRFEETWSEDQALDAIVFYLNQFSIECFSAFNGQSLLPEIPIHDPKRIEFRVNSFIRWIHREKLDVWDSMTVLVRSKLVANALLCPDLEALQKNFSKVTFYFDTRVLLRLLGLEGQEGFGVTAELIRLVTGLGASVSYFAHTARELEEVLTRARRTLNSPQGRGTVIWHARDKGMTDSDFVVLQTTYKERLGKFCLFVTPTPAYSTKFQIGELALGDLIDNELGSLRENVKAHDINCVRSIYELRSGIAPTRLEDAKAVFVTANVGLSRAAYQYGRNYEVSREVSAIVTDYSITNVAWLKSPMSASDLPVREMLALAYAAIQPSEHLWGLYLHEVEKLKNDGAITPDAHGLLRYHLKAREELMDLTEGADQELGKATVLEVLTRLETSIKAKESEKLLSEQAAHQETYVKFVETEGNRVAQRIHLETQCRRAGIAVGWVIFCVVACALAVGTWVATYSLSDVIAWKSAWKFPLIALTGFSAVAGLLGMFWGYTLGALKGKVEEWSKQRLLVVFLAPSDQPRE